MTQTKEANVEKERLAVKSEALKIKRKARLSQTGFVASFLALPILNFLIFYVYVNFDSLLMAFKRPVLGQGYNAAVWSFENFNIIWKSLSISGGGVIWRAFVNTMLFSLTGMAVGFPIGVLMCYFIYKKIRMYHMFRFVAYLPNIITSSALVILFKNAVGPGGPLDALAMKLGISYSDPLTSESSAIWAILFYYISFGFGSNLIVVGGAMTGINSEMLESAAIDGCNWFKELIYMIVPSIWPTISTILVLNVAGCLGSTGPILAFSKGDYNTMTLSFYIYQLVSGAGTGEQDLYLASALGIVMTAISFPIAMLVRKITYGKED